MKPKFRQYFQEDIDECLSLLHHFDKVAGRYNRTEMKELLTDRLNEFLTDYYMDE